tara:strand:- start:491 stop:658 length:168 start_codon:yes stop_codon:yes gene_type:complete
MVVQQNKKEVTIKLKKFEWIKLKFLFDNFNISYNEVKEYLKEKRQNKNWRFANDK